MFFSGKHFWTVIEKYTTHCYSEYSELLVYKNEHEVIMYALKEVQYAGIGDKPLRANLVADIGGTNSNFGIFTTQAGQARLIISLHAKSQEVTDFIVLFKQVIEHLKQYYKVTVRGVVIAAAGVVAENRDVVKPTNLSISIDSRLLMQAIPSLCCVCIANDFEVIGYGISAVETEKLVVVKPGTPRVHANKAIIGAGTGLGKCTMVWNYENQAFIPSLSEGGHADFAIHNALELALCSYIIRYEKRSTPLSWEDLLSGKGIQRIYSFFYTQICDDFSQYHPPHPDEIFVARLHDECARKTAHMYAQMYGRCAKNFALETLALAGVYIAGGIAAKNVHLFEQDSFLDEFVTNGVHTDFLKQIPITVITDYNVSLYGAIAFMNDTHRCNSTLHLSTL